MSTNFVYGSGNPLFKEPKKETKTKTETKAQIDARIAANTQKAVERLKPLQEKYGSRSCYWWCRIVPAGAGGAPSW
jgi:hypothetical protein